MRALLSRSPALWFVALYRRAWGKVLFWPSGILPRVGAGMERPSGPRYALEALPVKGSVGCASSGRSRVELVKIHPPMGSEAAKTGTLFAETGTLFGKTGTLLGETGTILGKTGTFLGETGILLGKTGTLLGETGTILGKTGTLLDETGTILGETGTILEKSGTLLGEIGTLFGKTGTLLGETGTVCGVDGSGSWVAAPPVRRPLSAPPLLYGITLGYWCRRLVVVG